MAREEAAVARQEALVARRDAEAARVKALCKEASATEPAEILQECLVKHVETVSSTVLACDTPLAGKPYATPDEYMTQHGSPSRRRRARLQAQVAYEASEAVASALVDCFQSLSHESPEIGRVARASSLLRSAMEQDGLPRDSIAANTDVRHQSETKGSTIVSHDDDASSYQPLLSSPAEDIQPAENSEQQGDAKNDSTGENDEDGHMEDESTRNIAAPGYLPFSTGSSPKSTRRTGHSAPAVDQESGEAAGEDAVDWQAVREEVRTTAQLVYERILATAAMLENEEDESDDEGEGESPSEMQTQEALTLDSMLAVEDDDDEYS